MKKNLIKKAFTLVELIIVIAIIAILAVTAFLLLTKWLSKARDSSRASNLANIENSLQISLTEKSSLPKPDNYTLIYASGTSNVIGYQGYFGEGVKDAVGNINSAPKDGDDYFTYYLNANLNKYQLAGFMENEVAYNPNVVSAVDYASRYVSVKGDKLGLLTDSNKSPLQTLGLTGLDISTGNTTYIAYFDNSNKISGTGKQLITMLTLNNKDLAKYDTGLVGYWDMETTVTSGGMLMLKDLSGYGNHGTCYASSGVTANCGQISGGPQFVDGKKGKAMQFDGTGNYVVGNFFDSSKFASGFTMCSYAQKLKNNNNRGAIFQIVSISGVLRYNRTAENVNSYWESSAKIAGSWEPRIVSDYSSNDSKMIYLCYSWDTSIQRIYINGSLIKSASRVGDLSARPIKNYSLGGLIDGNTGISGSGRLFNGIIDEARIYNRALSDDEVKALHNAAN